MTFQAEYTAFYCEENIYLLCKDFLHGSKKDHQPNSKFYAVFISNQSESVPLWLQRNSSSPQVPVVWDYHVIMVQINDGVKGGDEGCLVYDLDTTLPCPCPLRHYVNKTFYPRSNHPQYEHSFRIIPAQTYLDLFASDRSHMRKPTGEWNAPPPSYPPIAVPGCTMNLMEFRSMVGYPEKGQVVKLDGFIPFFASQQKS